VLAALWLAAAAIGCGGAAEPAGPPEIEWGERECDRCRMILSEPRYAAAAVADGGEVAVFDDLACLAAWVRAGDAVPQRIWVHDHSSGEWIDARSAAYERRPDLVTPMGSGLVALRSAGLEGAESSSLTFAELIEETEHVR